MAKKKAKPTLQVAMDAPQIAAFRIATLMAKSDMTKEINGFVRWYLHQSDTAPKRPAKPKP